jgi:hypothetical protein
LLDSFALLAQFSQHPQEQHGTKRSNALQRENCFGRVSSSALRVSTTGRLTLEWFFSWN